MGMHSEPSMPRSLLYLLECDICPVPMTCHWKVSTCKYADWSRADVLSRPF